MVAECVRTAINGSWTLANLLDGLLVVAPSQDRVVTGLTLYSSQVAHSELFCALCGTTWHGLEFAEQAAANGAVAILAEITAEWPVNRCEALAKRLGIPILAVPELEKNLSAIAGRFYGEPAADLDLIGITGTNGKTSVCQFVAQALNPDPICGAIGTIGYGISNALTKTGTTTPNAVHLQAILRQLHDLGAKAVAMEVSSHALDQYRTAALPFATAVFTNLTRDHLDYHGNLQAYAQAKMRLFGATKLQHAVLNADDPLSREIIAGLSPSVSPVLYSLNPSFLPLHESGGWLRLDFLEHQSRGMRLWISSSWGRGDITVPTLGRFNAANLLAALGVLLVRNPDFALALQRIERIRGVPGRMECFGNAQQPLVVVDYAHTPDALEQVLIELKSHQPKRIITLFGCGGERDRGKRPQMGAIAERLSDLVILTDDNPRAENGDDIILGILAGMATPAAVRIERRRDYAIREAISTANTGDIVLIAGKGHEDTQRIGNIDYPFSDQSIVAQMLSA